MIFLVEAADVWSNCHGSILMYFSPDWPGVHISGSTCGEWPPPLFQVKLSAVRVGIYADNDRSLPLGFLLLKKNLKYFKFCFEILRGVCRTEEIRKYTNSLENCSNRNQPYKWDSSLKLVRMFFSICLFLVYFISWNVFEVIFTQCVCVFVFDVVCDYMGERLASLFGITTPKYQYAIDEYYRMKKEVRQTHLHILEYHVSVSYVNMNKATP